MACHLIAGSVECGAVTGYLRLPETDEQLAVVDIDRHGNSVEGMRRPLHSRASAAGLPQRRRFRVGNATGDPRTAPFETDAPVHYESVLLTPVADETGVGAVLGLFDTHRDWFDADDQTLMETVAEQLAAALRGVRLRDEADRRARRLTLALDIATAVAAAPTVEAAIRGTVRTLAEGLACESIGGFLALPETGEQLAIAEIEHHGPSVEGMRHAAGHGPYRHGVHQRPAASPAPGDRHPGQRRLGRRAGSLRVRNLPAGHAGRRDRRRDRTGGSPGRPVRRRRRGAPADGRRTAVRRARRSTSARRGRAPVAAAGAQPRGRPACCRSRHRRRRTADRGRDDLRARPLPGSDRDPHRLRDRRGGRGRRPAPRGHADQRDAETAGTAGNGHRALHPPAAPVQRHPRRPRTTLPGSTPPPGGRPWSRR